MISLPGIWRAVVGLRFPSGFSKGIKTGGRTKIVNKGARLLQDKQPAGNKPAVDSRKLGAY